MAVLLLEGRGDILLNSDLQGLSCLWAPGWCPVDALVGPDPCTPSHFWSFLYLGPHSHRLNYGFPKCFSRVTGSWGISTTSCARISLSPWHPIGHRTDLRSPALPLSLLGDPSHSFLPEDLADSILNKSKDSGGQPASDQIPASLLPSSVTLGRIT